MWSVFVCLMYDTSETVWDLTSVLSAIVIIKYIGVQD